MSVFSNENSNAFLQEVDRRLRAYGTSRHNNPEDPLDDLIFIILSSQTEEYAYLKTFRSLKKRFPAWDMVLTASSEEISSTIKQGGLYNKKAKQLKQALQRIHDDFGELSLSRLRNLDNQERLRYLRSLPGISAKSARCILMYTMEAQVFPVDTHVWRICRRLGLTPSVPKPNEAQQLDLEAKVPEALRFSLHVNMVSHGRKICTTYWPKCNSCILSDICVSRGKADDVWGEWRKPRGIWAGYADTEVDDE